MNTVEDCMTACGVPLILVFDGDTPTEQVVEQIFLNWFETCLSITIDDVKEAISAFTMLVVATGKISFQPGIKRKNHVIRTVDSKSVTLWHRSKHYRFPVTKIIDLFQDLTSCQQFEKRSTLIASQVKPKQFTPKTLFVDWEPTFRNYLSLIPGQHGKPLSRMIRRSVAPDPLVVRPIMDQYVENDPLVGVDYDHDSQHVLILLLRHLTEYPEAETIVRTATQNNGRVGFETLVFKFEGSGAMRVYLIAAEKTVTDLLYMGEKKPTMYWEKIEKEVKYAYSIIDRRNNRVVYDDEQQLRSLLNYRIKTDFLSTILAVLKIQLGTIPMTLTFANALKSLRNEVNIHNATTTGAKFINVRDISEINSR